MNDNIVCKYSALSITSSGMTIIIIYNKYKRRPQDPALILLGGKHDFIKYTISHDFGSCKQGEGHHFLILKTRPE